MTKKRVWNFSPGPSVLPEEVLKRAAAEMLDYDGSGMSVMEMSHRSKGFQTMVAATERNLRELLCIPDHYKVLFLQGGASTQFAMVPLNLMSGSGSADYIHTGNWSRKAIQEARRYGRVRVVASSEDAGFLEIPTVPQTSLDPAADYLHITVNNTISGTRFHHLPESGRVPLVVDMSSSILSEPVNVADFGLIYAGAQKNAGSAGLTLVIIREDLLGRAQSHTPTMLDYATHAKAGSLYNTPPSFAIYIAGLVYQWLLDGGGLTAMAAKNRAKADLFYDYLDRSRLFSAKISPPHRSLMNLTFGLTDDRLNQTFVDEAEALGLTNLKGHRSVGGMRASLYNAMPMEGVRRLVAFMTDFEKTRL